MDKVRISFASHYKFPLKLFEVVSDDTLLKWSSDGEAVIAEQREFENHVMQCYPGFVQVKSFHNLRRLFRDYSFRYAILRRKRPYGLKIKFWHAFFRKNEPEQLFQVRKKKSRFLHPLATSSPKSTERRQRTRFASALYDASNSVSFDLGEVDSLTPMFVDSTDSELSLKGISWPANNSTAFSVEDHLKKKWSLSSQYITSSVSQISKHGVESNSLTKDDLSEVLQIYAKNEMSDAEYLELLLRRYGARCQDGKWETIAKLLDTVLYHELSPLHHKGFYYELGLDEL